MLVAVLSWCNPVNIFTAKSTSSLYKMADVNQETGEEEPCLPSWQTWESTKRKIRKGQVGNIPHPDFLNPDCGLALSGEVSAEEKVVWLIRSR